MEGRRDLVVTLLVAAARFLDFVFRVVESLHEYCDCGQRDGGGHFAGAERARCSPGRRYRSVHEWVRRVDREPGPHGQGVDWSHGEPFHHRWDGRWQDPFPREVRGGRSRGRRGDEPPMCQNRRRPRWMGSCHL